MAWGFTCARCRLPGCLPGAAGGCAAAQRDSRRGDELKGCYGDRPGHVTRVLLPAL